MKEIIGYIRTQVKEDFHVTYYAVVFLFLSLTLYVNYQLQFSDNYISVHSGGKRVALNFLFYSTAYFTPVLLLGILKTQWSHLVQKEFILKSLLGIFLLSLNASYPFSTHVLKVVPNEIRFWVYKIYVNMTSIFIIFTPLFLVHLFVDTNKTTMYGLGNVQFNARPYLLMLLIMFPFIAGAAAFSQDFQNQYPMYPKTEAYKFLGVPEVITTAIYELAYGIDFIGVELFFRGFFVIGMISVLGRSAILPMASMYCFLHFGKPAAEAISSIFGGYLLGTLAYQTKSLWGGIIAHLGIAWMMELCAFIQKLITNE